MCASISRSYVAVVLLISLPSFVDNMAYAQEPGWTKRYGPCVSQERFARKPLTTKGPVAVNRGPAADANSRNIGHNVGEIGDARPRASAKL